MRHLLLILAVALVAVAVAITFLHWQTLLLLGIGHRALKRRHT